MTSTHEQGLLLVELMRWGADIGLEPALSAIFAEEFGPDTAPMDDPSVAIVTSFGETVGAFVKHGLIDRSLLLDVFWIDGMWARVEPHVIRAREMEGHPALYENFEALVTKETE
jgi:hypothetical protein